MKKLLAIWLGVLAPWAGAQTHVYFDLAAPFFNALPASNRVVTLQPLTPFPGNSITYTSSASGTFYHSNAFVGDYVGSIRARGLANEIKFQITVTATNLGVVNADTITSLTGQQSYPSTGRASWSIQASDQRYVPTPTNAAAANDGDVISKTGNKTKYVAPGSGSGVFTAAGTNVTAQTNGNIVTINADVSTASVAAKADTNAPTLYSPTNIAMAAFAPTNSSIEPVVLVVPNDVNQSFYFGTVFPGTIGEGTISIGNRNDADGHSSFVAGNANITYAHNSTVVGNANDVGNALNGEKNVVFGHGNSVSQNNTNVVVVGVANAVLVDGKTNIINFGYGNAVTETLAGAIGFNLDNSTLGTIDIGLDNSTKASIGQTVARFRTPISSSGMTNSGTTDALIYADANGKYGEATAANVYGLWTGTGTYMTRFGTNANVSGGDALTSNPLSQFAATTSAQLRGVLSDETGTGAAVFANGNIGAASGTSLTLSGLTAGRVTFAGTSGLLSDDSAFRWNSTTKALELGVADTTAGRLDLFGDNDGASSGVIAMLADSPTGEDRMVFTNAGGVAGFKFVGGPLDVEGVTNSSLTASRLLMANAEKKEISVGHTSITKGDGTAALWSDIAALITGTPDGSKFLRDDGTWQVIPGGGDALTSNPLSQFAATTSAQLAGVLSDESGSGHALFTTGGATTNAHVHNPTNQWSNPSGTIKTRYTDNLGNPRLDFLGQSDTIQFSVFWENSTSGGIYAPYLQGNGSLLTALNASALASGLAPPQRLAPTNSVPVDGTYALFFRSGTNVWLLSNSSVPGISNVLAANNDAGGLSLSNVNWLVVSNAYYQNFYVDTNHVTNFFLASLASNQVPVASGGGQLLGDTGLTFERTSDTLTVGNLVTGKKLLFGQNVTSDPEYASIVGGQSNRITGTNLWSFIGGGTNNNIAAGTSGALIAANGASAIVAGRGNTISYHSTNNGYVINSFIGAGRGNRILTSGEGNSVIVGGIDNTTEASNGFIGGGNANYTYSGVYAVIAGGAGNITSNATHAIIPGGASNYVAGNFSQAAGLGAHALNSGTYVWADGTTAAPFASTANNQFLIRAAGGVGINTNNPGSYALVVKGNTLLDGQVTGNGLGLTNVHEKNLVVTTNSWGNAVPDFSRGTMLLTNLAGNLTLTDPTGFVSSNLNWQTIALNPDGATRVITVPEAWYVSGAFTNQTTAALTNGTVGTLRIEALIGIRTNAALEISQ